METICNAFGGREASPGNLFHIGSHIQCYLTHLVAATTRKFKQDRGNRTNIRTFNDTNNTAFTTVSRFINQHSIEFSTGQSHFVNADVGTNVLLKQEPVLCVRKLIPVVGNHLNGFGIDVPVSLRQLHIKHLMACN